MNTNWVNFDCNMAKKYCLKLAVLKLGDASLIMAANICHILKIGWTFKESDLCS